MKMYEKLGMSTEDALKWIAGCCSRFCRECPAYGLSGHGNSTAWCAAEYLNAEAPENPKIPRWMVAKTQEDFDQLFTDFKVFCKWPTGCPGCKYNERNRWTSECYHAYLSELVDAPESEDNE